MGILVTFYCLKIEYQKDETPIDAQVLLQSLWKNTMQSVAELAPVTFKWELQGYFHFKQLKSEAPV